MYNKKYHKILLNFYFKLIEIQQNYNISLFLLKLVSKYSLKIRNFIRFKYILSTLCCKYIVKYSQELYIPK